MAAAPIYPSGTFVLNNTATGSNAVAEVTFASDAQISFLVSGALNTAGIQLAITDSSGLNPVIIAAIAGPAASMTLSGTSDGHKLDLFGDGSPVTGGGPIHVKAGCKIQASRDATADQITLHVSGWYF